MRIRLLMACTLACLLSVPCSAELPWQEKDTVKVQGEQATLELFGNSHNIELSFPLAVEISIWDKDSRSSRDMIFPSASLSLELNRFQAGIRAPAYYKRSHMYGSVLGFVNVHFPWHGPNVGAYFIGLQAGSNSLPDADESFVFGGQVGWMRMMSTEDHPGVFRIQINPLLDIVNGEVDFMISLGVGVGVLF